LYKLITVPLLLLLRHVVLFNLSSWTYTASYSTTSRVISKGEKWRFGVICVGGLRSSMSWIVAGEVTEITTCTTTRRIKRSIPSGDKSSRNVRLLASYFVKTILEDLVKAHRVICSTSSPRWIHD
jgi:hypothetical protein